MLISGAGNVGTDGNFQLDIPFPADASAAGGTGITQRGAGYFNDTDSAADLFMQTRNIGHTFASVIDASAASDTLVQSSAISGRFSFTHWYYTNS